jgi:hypothetical protein
MKDPADQGTGDVLASSAARRQAAYKKRRQREGYSRRTVWIHDASWQAGYRAAEAGEPCTPPSDSDTLSWVSGYIEGKGDR